MNVVWIVLLLHPSGDFELVKSHRLGEPEHVAEFSSHRHCEFVRQTVVLPIFPGALAALCLPLYAA